ncbi:hypothetical protein [Companilactobacillus kimchiensis]|uniref:Uncharacterized protein n=1 Tax=Companilactobacillus kimchiensis TaxID=993692 RepID=A0A0R2L7F2_9LACO|nr:hypothetical protein [Companilactobacillus kimchiensis]KRN97759.1 hypothetical protein IV57_GL001601 [Companilactobacillus kimchiensis]
MIELIGFILTILIVAFQSFAGYKHNKYLGMILPVIFIGSIIYLMAAGRFELTTRNIVMPIVGLVALIGLYGFAGRTKK